MNALLLPHIFGMELVLAVKFVVAAMAESGTSVM